MSGILSIMLIVPLVAAVACLFTTANNARWIALIATLIDLVLGGVLWANFEIGGPQWQFVEEALHASQAKLPTTPGHCIEHSDDPEALRKAKAARISAGFSLSRGARSEVAGSLSGVSEYLAKAAPVPPWLRELRRFVSETAGALKPTLEDDPSEPADPLWRAQRVWVPDRDWTFGPEGGLVLLLDVSGSMPGDVLDRVASAVNALAAEGVPTRLIAGDVSVAFDGTVRKFPRRITNVGGGTDITCLFERARGARAIVCVTDGYVPRWPENPGVPTLWVLPPDGPKPPFGKVVRW